MGIYIYELEKDGKLVLVETNPSADEMTGIKNRELIGKTIEEAFPQLAERLQAVGQVAFNDYMLRLGVNGYELNVFPDGRTIIKGCTDPALARTLYARYIGS